MNMNRLKLPILVVLTFLSLVIHFYRLFFISEFANSHLLQVVHARFCYIPIVLGAFWYGLRGGTFVAFLVSVATFIYIVYKPVMNPNNLVNEYTEIVFYLILGGLSGVVLDRERALQKKKDEAEKKLEEAERFALMGKMAASIAHEVKNPLGSIKGAAQIIGDQSTTEDERAEFASIIHKETDRLDGVIRDFLAYSRPSPVNISDVDICGILEAVRKQLRFQAEKQGIKLSLVAEPVAIIKADGDKLHQVFLNIMLNAIQAMPEGGKIEMSCGEVDGRLGRMIKIEIADTGPGIEPPVLDRIFDPFYSTKSQGTGLGLSTARAIIAEHRGNIEVRSRPGEGTVFRVILPLNLPG